METISITNLTPQQETVVLLLINEGKMQAYDELQKHFTQELHKIAPDDSNHGAYIEYVIEEITKRLKALTGEEVQE